MRLQITGPIEKEREIAANGCLTRSTRGQVQTADWVRPGRNGTMRKVIVTESPAKFS